MGIRFECDRCGEKDLREEQVFRYSMIPYVEDTMESVEHDLCNACRGEIENLLIVNPNEYKPPVAKKSKKTKKGRR